MSRLTTGPGDITTVPRALAVALDPSFEVGRSKRSGHVQHGHDYVFGFGLTVSHMAFLS